MQQPKLIDKFYRHINYLRISVTDRCNLRCIYCVPPKPVPKLSHTDILTYEEILHLVKTGVGLGISKVRITGGEPLVRKGLYDFLAQLTDVQGLKDVSLTTNGLNLKKNAEKIRSAGIKRINISLDTLNKQKFKTITGCDRFSGVWESIMFALETGFNPVKLNVVVLNGINDDELSDIARLSFSYPFHIRFIEYMPIGNPGIEISNPPLLTPEVKKRISVLGRLIPIKNSINDGPARRFKFAGAEGEIGFISPLSEHFCNKCNRLRLTANGWLRPCLLSDYQADIKTSLRQRSKDRHPADIFLNAITYKERMHYLGKSGCADKVNDQMSKIGG